MTCRDYMARVSSAELGWQQAYEELNGPQGEDRADWRMAYICYYIAVTMGGAKQVTVADYLPKFERIEEAELIDDDPELSERRAAELLTKFVGIVGVAPDGSCGKPSGKVDG